MLILKNYGKSKSLPQQYRNQYCCGRLFLLKNIVLICLAHQAVADHARDDDKNTAQAQHIGHAVA